MADGSEANPVGAIDRIHAQIVGESADEPEQIPAVEAQPDKIVSANNDEDFDPEFAREVIAEICETNRAATYDEFYQDLQPVVGHAIADRIAKRAAMAEPIKNAYVKHGGSCAKKYGIAQFLDSETILAGAMLLHWRGLSAAKREREKLLKKHSPANGAQRDSATGRTYPIETKQETAQPREGLTANAPITTIELVERQPE